jgi:hypothetical protein
MTDFERFEFRPWMGYVAGVLLFAAGGGGKSDVAMLLRGLGLTVFFGAIFWSHHTHRRRTGAGASVGELKSFVFALFCGLITLLMLVALLWRAAE